MTGLWRQICSRNCLDFVLFSPLFFFFSLCSLGVHSNLRCYTGRECHRGGGETGYYRHTHTFPCYSELKGRACSHLISISMMDLTDGAQWSMHVHCWWVFWHKAANYQPWCCGRREDKALLKDTVRLRPAPTRCVMTREGSKCYHVRHSSAIFEAMPARPSLRRHFLEHSDAQPAPEDCGRRSEGHGDLVLPDLSKLGTCLEHAAL